MIKVMGGKPKDNRSGKEKMKDGKAGNKSQQGAANLIDLVGGKMKGKNMQPTLKQAGLMSLLNIKQEKVEKQSGITVENSKYLPDVVQGQDGTVDLTKDEAKDEAMAAELIGNGLHAKEMIDLVMDKHNQQNEKGEPGMKEEIVLSSDDEDDIITEQELPTTPIPNQTPTNLAKHNKQPAV